MADLCLGTAQLGMKYGINNKVGKLNETAVFEILDVAIENKIKILDTATIYGDAEKLLGDYLFSNRAKTKDINIVSKQCESVEGCNKKQIEEIIRKELEKTLKNLQRDKLDGYLLHSYKEVHNKETLHVLQKLKEEGVVKKIGASVYDVEEAEAAMRIGEIDYLQMPCSIFDQRGLQSNVFKKAKEQGVEVFTRSAFLQGLLMMREAEVPKYLESIIPYVNEFEKLLQFYELDRKHAIVKFILSRQEIDYMVFGVETKKQLEEIIIEKDSGNLPDDFLHDVEQKFNNIPLNLILPIFWNKTS